jgi:hypothetical protein
MLKLQHTPRWIPRMQMSGYQEQTVSSNLLWLAVNGLSLLALSLILFRLQAPVTFFRYDGTFILSVVKNQGEWMPGFGAYNIDFLKGMGGLWFPLHTRLVPGFVIGLLAGDGEWLPALSATWFATEFAVATLFMSRTVGLPIPSAIAAVWLGLFGALPYLVPTLAIERIWGNPHLLSLIAFTTVALALFLRIGRKSPSYAIGCAVGIILILAYLTLVYPLSAMLFLPVLGFFGVVGLTMTSSRTELRWKLAAAVGLVLVYMVLFSAWLPGLILHAKTTFFWSEMYPTWSGASLLIERPDRRPAGVVFLLAAVLGGVLTAFGRERALRRFAIGYLAFVGLLWACTGILIVTGYEWRGPAVSYLDFMIYPLHALFAAQCLYWALLRVASLARLRAAVPALVMAAAAFVPWAALAVWVPPYEKPLLKNEIPFRWPPLRTPIVDFLQREIALRPGQPFRGRVANLAGSRFEPQFAFVPYINQHNYDGMVAFFLGNDHREYGFWFYDVPTLEETNHVTSPFFHALLTRLLNPEGALFVRQHETASLFMPRILAQLGVRYVLTDEPLPERTPVRELEMVPTRRQYLYELEDPNVSGRGITQVILARNAAEALMQMRAPDVDFHKEAVLFDPLPDDKLAPVSRSRIDVHRGFLTVSAEAPGRALLVLPVEFSRCLEFTWETSAAEPPVALRANLDQTAILFSGRLEGRLALRNGPFVNPTCRLRDLQDAARVELGKAR